MKPCGVTKASSASHIIVASVLLSVGCIGWRETLEIKECPLNPFFPRNASDIISMAANVQSISVLKNPETCPDTGTGQLWVLILLAGWTGDVFTHLWTGTWSMGQHEAAGRG